MPLELIQLVALERQRLEELVHQLVLELVLELEQRLQKK